MKPFIETLQKNCERSNRNASKNRNLYPIQEQISIRQIWTYDPHYDAHTGLWTFRDDIGFDEYLQAFLRMFTDRHSHHALIRGLSNPSEPLKLGPRQAECFALLSKIRDDWDRYRVIHKTLVEDEKKPFSQFRIFDDCEPLFRNPQFRELTAFTLRESVYKSKILNSFLPDLCVAYDSASRLALYREFKLSPKSSYTDLLVKLNRWLRKAIADFDHPRVYTQLRQADRPGYIFDLAISVSRITLPPDVLSDMPFWDQYVPLERPLSRILDKQFYQPGRSGKSPSAVKVVKSCIVEKTESNEATAAAVQQLRPLSGRGKPITRISDDQGSHFTWGDYKFFITNEEIALILNFIDKRTRLGASITDPPKNGLGAFLVKNNIAPSPRCASAIASALVADGLADWEGKKPMFLWAI
jgi:hypothetical protein